MNKNFSSGYKAQFKTRIVSRRIARLALRPRSIPRFKTWVPPARTASYLLPPELNTYL